MSRIPALDGLRAVAILMVLVFHASGYVIWGFAAMGVDLFFLLSGFLITSLMQAELARTGRIELCAFAVRRTLRLMPALWLMVATVLLITWQTYQAAAFRTVIGDAAATLTYTSNWVPTINQLPNRLLGHSWSLAVEAQFYVMWAVLATWLLPRLADRLLFALLVSTVFALCGWTVWAYQHSASPAHMVYGFDTRGAPLFAGCAIAVLLDIEPARAWLTIRLRRIGWAGAASLVALIGLALGFGVALPWILPLSVPALALLGGIVLIEITLVPDGKLARRLAWRLLVALGLVSYALYLWHFPLMRLAEEAGGGWLARWLVCFGIAPMVAALSWRFVERPTLALKRRFETALESAAGLDQSLVEESRTLGGGART